MRKWIYIGIGCAVVLIGIMYLVLRGGVETKDDVVQATQQCIERTDRTPADDFTSDGCSLWPDAKIQECCVVHDMDYWCGGDSAYRTQVDEAFGACVSERYEYFPSALVVLGVRVGGWEMLPLPWRWGYGDTYFQ